MGSGCDQYSVVSSEMFSGGYVFHPAGLFPLDFSFIKLFWSLSVWGCSSWCNCMPGFDRISAGKRIISSMKTIQYQDHRKLINKYTATKALVEPCNAPIWATDATQRSQWWTRSLKESPTSFPANLAYRTISPVYRLLLVSHALLHCVYALPSPFYVAPH